jgi:hypothetical protein
MRGATVTIMDSDYVVDIFYIIFDFFLNNESLEGSHKILGDLIFSLFKSIFSFGRFINFSMDNKFTIIKYSLDLSIKRKFGPNILFVDKIIVGI